MRQMAIIIPVLNLIVSCPETFPGIHKDDTQADMDYIVKKILKTKLFDSVSGERWKKTVVDENLEILCVSQFTLFAVLKGISRV